MALAGADASSAANAVIAAAEMMTFRMICLPRVFQMCLLQVAYPVTWLQGIVYFCTYKSIENLCIGNRRFMNVNLCL